MSRPTWDETSIDLALVMAKRSTCPRARVGAVLLSPQNVVLSTGYNGSPAGQPHCTDVGCLLSPQGSCLRTVHAEVNAIIRAGAAITRGCTLYSTVSPCFACANLIVQVNVTRVVYVRRYRVVPDYPDPLEYLRANGIIAIQFSGEVNHDDAC